MTNTTEKLELILLDLQAQRTQIDQDIEDLERVLRRRKPGPVSAALNSKKAPPSTFKRKYSENAVTLVRKVLQELRGRMAVPQILKHLEQEGKTFHRESINHALKKLTKAGEAFLEF